MPTQLRPDGAGTEGYWNGGKVAEDKFLGQVGIYSSGGTVVRLAEEAVDGRYVVIKSWSQQTGMVPGDAAWPHPRVTWMPGRTIHQAFLALGCALICWPRLVALP
ncbi:hypothetical protein ACIBCO_37465 [Streptomyces violascens]|uniref:hypothetical protein n=1 Tax=Streptomyces violascens TaxID=67381 RepID=UPI0037BB7AD4